MAKDAMHNEYIYTGIVLFSMRTSRYEVCVCVCVCVCVWGMYINFYEARLKPLERKEPAKYDFCADTEVGV